MLNDTMYIPKSMTKDTTVNANTSENSVVDVHAAMHQEDDLL